MSETLAFDGNRAIITFVMLLQGRKIILGTYFGLGNGVCPDVVF
jgi:hypothetical protein